MRYAAISTAVLFFLLLVSEATAAIPAAVTVARTTAIPACTLHVDAAFAGTSTGSASKPFKTIAAAVSAVAEGGIICVAQGTYAEQILPGTKGFTLAGGFQRATNFTVRDSAAFRSKAQGAGGSFIRIEDPGPSGDQLTAIDGFEITGYSQAILRDYFVSQRFNITNNFFHDNLCASQGLAGAGFSLNNVSGLIRGNVFLRNRCWRGGAGFLNDSTNENQVTLSRNRVEASAGTQQDEAHGGGLYLFTNRLTITGNAFVNNRVTAWGGGLYVGAQLGQGQTTTARLAWNVYRGNRAGIFGGGFFCDDGAKCFSDHEIYDGNCAGNIYVDSGPGTSARFDHLTNLNGKVVGCASPGAGVLIDAASPQSENYTFVNAIFWGNATGQDFVTSCQGGCAGATVTVSYSMVQKNFVNNGIPITFGKGILTPSNPRFVDPAAGNFHLKSTFGHWTPSGYVNDTVSSPALAKGNPASPVPDNPPRAGDRTELGAYGNSEQASYVR